MALARQHRRLHRDPRQRRRLGADLPRRAARRLRAHPDIDIVTGNGWFLGGRLDGQPARPLPDARPQPTLPTILADETSIFIMSLFRRRVYEAIGGFDETHAHQRGLRLLAARGPRRLPLPAQRPAARPLPPTRRQRVGDRRQHARRHPARLREDCARCCRTARRSYRRSTRRSRGSSASRSRRGRAWR